MVDPAQAARALLAQVQTERKAAPTLTSFTDGGTPAPDASPVGAFAFLADGMGWAQAWLDVEDGTPQPLAYLRNSLDGTTVQVDPDRWKDVVASLDMAEAPAPTRDDQTPAEAAPPEAPPPGAPETPAPAADAPPAPLPPEGKAAAATDDDGDAATDPYEAEESVGIMVALMVPGPLADALVVNSPGGLPAEDLHLTLAFLGDTTDVDDANEFVTRALTAIRQVAAENPVVEGQINGVGRFSTGGSGGGGVDAVWLSYDAPALSQLRQDLVEALERAGLTVSEDHGFCPHITVAYIDPGAKSPLARVEPSPLSFGELTLAFGEARIPTPLGSVDLGVEVALAEDYTYRPDSTAPSAQPGHLGGGGIKAKKPPTIANGSFVSWSGGRGRVDLVVTRGKVPGAPGDVEGTAGSPAARVVVYERSGSGWKATGRKYAAKVTTLKRIPPLTGGKASAAEGLVATLAEHSLRVQAEALPSYASPDPAAVSAVFDRGLKSAPAKLVDPEDWAVGRVRAFLAQAAGADVPGYMRDRDLLPLGHPLSTKVAEPDPDAVRLPAGDVAGMLQEWRTAVGG